MEYSLKWLLGLQAFKVNKVSNEDQTIVFEVFPRRKTGDCPQCSRRCRLVHAYLKNQRIKHIRIGIRLSCLSLTKRRFYCRYCLKAFTERVKPVKYRHRISQPAKDQALTHLVDRSFRAARKQTGIGYHSQRRYLMEKVQPFIWDWSDELSHHRDISLGMDEISFSGHEMIRVITNITDKRLKAILPDDTRLTLFQALKWIPPDVSNRIKEVAIDLNWDSKVCIEKYLPQAKVVADRFHVIQNANQRISRERTVAQDRVGRGFRIPKQLFEVNREDLTEQERLRLERYWHSFPELKFYWEAKERLREMYKQRNKQRAEEILNSLITAMEKTFDRDLKQWGRTLYRWKEPILNFFDNRTTNGFTEGVNTKLKLVKRISYGFRNREVFIRKAMLAFLPFTVLIPHLMA